MSCGSVGEISNPKRNLSISLHKYYLIRRIPSTISFLLKVPTALVSWVSTESPFLFWNLQYIDSCNQHRQPRTNIFQYASIWANSHLVSLNRCIIGNSSGISNQTVGHASKVWIKSLPTMRRSKLQRHNIGNKQTKINFSKGIEIPLSKFISIMRRKQQRDVPQGTIQF